MNILAVMHVQRNATLGKKAPRFHRERLGASPARLNLCPLESLELELDRLTESGFRADMTSSAEWIGAVAQADASKADFKVFIGLVGRRRLDVPPG